MKVHFDRLKRNPPLFLVIRAWRWSPGCWGFEARVAKYHLMVIQPENKKR